MYMYKVNLVLNNLQWSICHKTKTNQMIDMPSFTCNFYLL